MQKKIISSYCGYFEKIISDDCVSDSLVNYNTLSENKQLQTTLKQISDKFTSKKKKSIALASSYKRLNYIKRSERVFDCGTYLEFTEYSSDDEKLHLTYANFCRDRLCPMCSWRRTYKIFGQVSKIMDVIEKDYAFLFLTLTVPNVDGELLPAKVDQMQKAFNSFMRYSAIKKAVKGYIRILEITYNRKSDTFHPHFHVILAVSPSYFKHSDYIKRDDWLKMWQRAMKDNSITQVDVRRIKDKFSSDCVEAVQNVKSAVAEVAKYAVKDSDYIYPFSNKLTDHCVNVLLSSITKRRLIVFGGVFETVRKDFAFDPEDDDLVFVTPDGELRGDLALCVYRFSWSSGAYKLYNIENKKSPFIDCEDDY